MRTLPPIHPASVLLVLLLSLVPAQAGEPVIVVHPESRIQSLTRDEVVNIFMGRQKRLPNGTVAMPVEQAQPPALRARFYQLLVGKDLPDISAYWARLLYSGQAQPPQALSADEVLEVVSENRGAIGVLDAARVDRRVRVVHSLTR